MSMFLKFVYQSFEMMNFDILLNMNTVFKNYNQVLFFSFLLG